MEEAEEERREAAIASTPSLRSDFIPNNPNITQSQLHKFQELHRRRLQLKAKPKTKKKSKGTSYVVKEIARKDTSESIDHSSVSNSKYDILMNQSMQQHEISKELAPKKQRKLHWGLDTKERWERKSNM